MSARANPKAGRWARYRSRLFAQDGLTLMEVLVAMIVLVIGLFGYFGTLAASGTAITAAERADAMTQIGEQTLQSVEALPYASVSDSSTPSKAGTNGTNPAYYLVTGPVAGDSSCSTAILCYQWDPSSTTSAEPVDVNTTNGKAPAGPTTVVTPAPSGATCTTGNTTACQETFAVYVFVTDSTDSICGTTCSGTSYSYKRVTVAVKNTGPGSPKNPLYFSTIVYYPGSTSTGATGATGAQDPLYGATGATGTTTCLDNGTTVACTH
jgi:prepilin-type N-terminal cleavage/methylation domain-containing protein